MVGTRVNNGFLHFPGECSVTGQSHFKSFDNKYFTFSGVCQYLFAKDCLDNSFSVIIETVQVTAALAGVSEHVLGREWEGLWEFDLNCRYAGQQK